MHETPADLEALQALLDRSFAGAGRHLGSVITPERRLTAAQLAERLTGMVLLVLATVTADGRPIAGPVDGHFHRGALYFGTAPDAVRARHIAARPPVSATHLPGEELAVTVHGRAVPVDVRSPAASPFRRQLLDTYLPRYGAAWEHDFLDNGGETEGAPVYFRIEAERMFTFQMAADPA